MGRKIISGVSTAIVLLFVLLIVRFMPPFSFLFEVKPETLARQGLPIAQAISDYQRDHGLFPEKVADLVPRYLQKSPSKEWRMELGDRAALGRRGGAPHTSIRYWFSGPKAGQWRYYPDGGYRQPQIAVPGPVATESPLSGEALFAAQLTEYEHRIARHPRELWYYEDKICFLGLSNRTVLLLADCERAAKEFPDWWLPQFTRALYSPTNSEARQEFESWVQAHGSHVNYWLLATYYREKAEVVNALVALNGLTKQPFVKYPEITRWGSGGRFLFDACKFAYAQRDFGLCLKLAQHYRSGGTTYEEQSRLEFETAAELASGNFATAVDYARNVSPALLQAVEARDTNYFHKFDDPEPHWNLFREPTP